MSTTLLQHEKSALLCLLSEAYALAPDAKIAYLTHGRSESFRRNYEIS